MTSPLVDHIGILVPDLEAAIERWSAVTGYTFVAGQLALEYKIDDQYGAMRFDMAP